MLNRLKNHVENDVFERRTEPPADWNKPLPDYLQGIIDFTPKKHEILLLMLKIKSMDIFYYFLSLKS